MIKPPIPSDESQRLKTLRDLRLLDTPPEERFDRVTRLAKQVFAAPIALVSLVDADRQWFKSRQGLDAAETPRDISFCGHAIVDDEIMIVNDAATDQRFCDNPLVCDDPNIRFYAAYPLAAPDGSRVGTLCIIDNKPRELSDNQLQLLSELGRMVEEELKAANDATIDPLTEMSNRNGFVAIANHLLPLCKRKDEPATLMMFHLAELQDFEEQHGRYEGDTLAAELGRLLMAGFRGSDIVARITIDVFAILMAGTPLDGAEEARKRFEQQLDARNRDTSHRHQLHVAMHTLAYDEKRHNDAEMLLADGEDLILQAFEEHSAATAKAG